MDREGKDQKGEKPKPCLMADKEIALESDDPEAP